MVAACDGRVDWRWRIRDLWVMMELSAAVERKTGGGRTPSRGGTCLDSERWLRKSKVVLFPSQF